MSATSQRQSGTICRCAIGVAVLLSALGGCGFAPAPNGAEPDLTGAWRAKVRFESGAFASIPNLEFMYVFNAGGTLTESSNYDGAPPVPPAYGIWRRTGPRQFEARYEFFTTTPPTRLDDLARGGGWLPAGRGVLTEQIVLAADGQSFTSTLRYEAFDRTGAVTMGGGTGRGEGQRLSL